MQITEDGKRTVASLEFALEFGRRIDDLRQEGNLSEHEQVCALAAMVAWVLTGHDINREPQGHEIVELVKFTAEHANEVDQIVHLCLSDLMEHDGHGPISEVH
jgi:hypothetical protein